MKAARPLLMCLALAAPLNAASAEPLEIFSNRPFVTVTVNGRRVVALLDSAAEMTILDDDLAVRLGLTASGSATAHGSGADAMQARFADHVMIGALGLSLEQRVAILDLGEVSRRLLGRPVEMFFGREIFDQSRLKVDFEGGTIEVVAEGIRPRGAQLPVSDRNGVPVIPASVEDREPVATAFDLGNGSEVLIGHDYAARIGLTAPERIVEQHGGGGLGGAVPRDIVVLRRLTIGGRTFRDVRAAIDAGETATDLNIGTSILRHFVIITDFPHHALWLEPRS
jgi:predicted aspartyl protease